MTLKKIETLNTLRDLKSSRVQENAKQNGLMKNPCLLELPPWIWCPRDKIWVVKVRTWGRMTMKLDREHKARDKSSLISPKTLEVAAHEWGPSESVYISCIVTLHLGVLGRAPLAH